MNIVNGFCQEQLISLLIIARRRPTTGIQNGGLSTGSTLYLCNRMRYQRNSNGLSRPTSGNVGSVSNESGMVENVGVAVGISLISAGSAYSRWFPTKCIISGFSGHIGVHLEFQKCHVTNSKYAFYRKIYPTPNPFYACQYLS